MRRSLRAFGAACAALAGLGWLGTLAAGAPSSGRGLPAIEHVFVIVLENESASTTFGPSSAAPYLARTLASQGAFVPNYYGIGHASLDNYVSLISGQAPNPDTQADCHTFSDFVATGPVAADGQLPGSGCVYPASVPSLPGQLDSAGLTWRAYMDGMGADPSRESATCGHPAVGSSDQTQTATAMDQYAARHDPFVYFHAVIDNQPYCDSHVVALSQLASDLASVGTTPSFSFITPSLCNDGHDTPCANGQPGGLTQVNTFLSTLVPELQASPAYQRDGLIAIVFDESEGGDTAACCGGQAGGGRTGAVFLSPFIKPGTATDASYNHYSLLRTIEDVFGLSHLGLAAQAGLAPLGSDVFTAAPATTSSSTTTATTQAPPPCRPHTTGAVLGGRTVMGHALVLTVRRSGTLTFQIHPARGSVLALQHRRLQACRTVTLALPPGHGFVQLTASAGSRHDRATVRF
jgi:hypothetical protein